LMMSVQLDWRLRFVRYSVPSVMGRMCVMAWSAITAGSKAAREALLPSAGSALPGGVTLRVSVCEPLGIASRVRCCPRRRT